MRHLKLVVLALSLCVSTSIYANPTSDRDGRKGSVSYEIERMLLNSGLIIEEDFKVTVIFQVTEDKRIDIRNIKSPNEEVNEFLRMRLQDQKLSGQKWFSEKIYELPVRVQAVR